VADPGFDLRGRGQLYVIFERVLALFLFLFLNNESIYRLGAYKIIGLWPFGRHGTIHSLVLVVCDFSLK